MPYRVLAHCAWPSRPLVEYLALLIAVGCLEVCVDGDRCLASHLGVEVAQVGGALAVVEKAVEAEGQGAGDPQAAASQDEGDQPPGRAGPAVQVGGCLDLGHDLLVQTPVYLSEDRPVLPPIMTPPPT